MSTKIKTLVLNCFLLLMAGNTLSQEIISNRYSIDSVPEYKVINSEMCKAIDTLIFYTKDCGHFSALNHPYLIWICLYDTSWFSVSSIPYSSTLISMFKADSRSKEVGFCNYNEHTVFIHSFVSNYINHFFEPTGKTSNLYYDNSENIIDHVFSEHRGIKIFFDYFDNQIVKDEYAIHEELCWSNRYYFFYMVQPEDTWLDISKKCGCSVEDLTDGYADSEKPIPGYFIMVEYGFVNSKSVNAVRIQ